MVSCIAGYYGTATKDEKIVVDRQTAKELEEKKLVQIIEKDVDEPETGSGRLTGGMWTQVTGTSQVIDGWRTN